MDTEVLIIGAGVFGLSAARALKKAGRDVLVVDAEDVAAGASATPLGVLAPHAPDRWNEKKQAQLEALTSLPGVSAALFEETGIDIGYRRCGRLIPLTRESHVPLWQARSEDAAANWDGKASVTIARPDPAWLTSEAAPFGAALCSLTARIDARAYCRALAASVGQVRGGMTLESLQANAAVFATGERMTARHIVLATGADTFRHLPDTAEGIPAGRGEKGQAALLRLAPGSSSVDEMPLIYRDRLYIVPQGSGVVAVGATSERDYTDPISTDAQLDTLVERAMTLSPALAGAEVIEKWARLRPRAADKRLLVGPHPSIVGVWVATGGFKTGLAMAHRVAENLAMQIGA